MRAGPLATLAASSLAACGGEHAQEIAPPCRAAGRSPPTPRFVAPGDEKALAYATWHLDARVAEGHCLVLTWEEGRWRIADRFLAWIS